MSLFPTSGSEPAHQAAYDQVLAANVAVHSRLAGDYNTVEPQFRPENLARVEKRMGAVCVQAGNVRRLLDLGCGTGFMIQIARKFVEEIDGIDATAAMLAAVEREGPGQIRLFRGDTASYPVEERRYDVVTAYSFLHHLYDIQPTLATAFRALRPGGMIFVDQEPNYYFWESIKTLDSLGSYDPIVRREIIAVTAKDEEIECQFGVDRDTFNRAEYQKAVLGGFREEDLRRILTECGFTEIAVHYHWFVGQGALVNRPAGSMDLRLAEAKMVEELLVRALPVSRVMFKYVGFTARAEK